MRCFLAIVRDSLLALRHRRMFWLHLWLNVLVVLLYAGVACGEQGWSIGFGLKEMQDPWLRSGSPWESTLHSWTLSRIMRFWVAGGGLFLALFATSALLPETLDRGHAALIVPQARRRSLILAGRWVGSVIYAMGHTVVCVGGLYLALKLRLGYWHHSLWLAVPVCVLLFAPLQAMAALLGVITRSATAALLVALLFAGTVWALNSAAAPQPAAAVHSAEDEDESGSGLSEVLASESLQYASAVLPPARDALTWLELSACPRPARSYTELFRRLRLTHREGFSGAAANVLAETAAPPAQRRERTVPAVVPLVLPSLGFTLVVLLLAGRLLRRRDL